MQVANTIPHFECNELRALIPTIVEKGRELLASMPASQKAAALAIKYFAGAIAITSAPLFFYGVFTFSAIPLASSVVLLILGIIVGQVVKKIFGDALQVYVCEAMANPPQSLKKYANETTIVPSSITKDLTEWVGRIERWQAYEPGPAKLAKTFCGLAYAQIALNEFRNTLFKTEEVTDKMKKQSYIDFYPEALPNFQDEHFAPKMKKAAKKAVDILTSEKDLRSTYVIHLTIVTLLTSFNLSFKKDDFMSEVNMIIKDRQNIHNSLKGVSGIIPMVSNSTVGLNSYLKEILPRMDAC